VTRTRPSKFVSQAPISHENYQIKSVLDVRHLAMKRTYADEDNAIHRQTMVRIIEMMTGICRSSKNIYGMIIVFNDGRRCYYE
jgi:hypothetical protein